MAHFAKLDDNNFVETVVVVPDEQEHRGEQYLNEIGLEGRWIQTSFNANIRKRFAGKGDEYLVEEDAFRQRKPFDSWVWQSETWTWESPIKVPDLDNKYNWDEESTSWVLVEAE